METESANWSRLSDAIESLRQQLERLGERVAALEKAASSVPPAAAWATAGTAVAQPPAVEGLSEEVVLVISAAVAAFLGKKAPIRQIRLLGSTAWAQQGRVTIQASHTLEAHTGRR